MDLVKLIWRSLSAFLVPLCEPLSRGHDVPDSAFLLELIIINVTNIIIFA